MPVLLGYSLGKSQEILCALLKAGLTPMLHGSVHRMTELYRELNPDFPTGYVRYSAGEIEGKVLVCPPSTARSLMLQRIQQSPHRRPYRLGARSRREIPLRLRRRLSAHRSRRLP